MAISLSRAQIDAALPKVKEGLEKYQWLQRHRDRVNVSLDRTYQRKFNHFYRVRRGVTWQAVFYKLLEQRKGQHTSYCELLETLHKATHRYEASFASKLAATIDPTLPVIDSIVLTNLGLKLPASGVTDRLSRIEELHSGLRRLFADYLATDDGKYLVVEFTRSYPDGQITHVKMLDLVLWQTRRNHPPQRSRRKRRAAESDRR